MPKLERKKSTKPPEPQYSGGTLAEKPDTARLPEDHLIEQAERVFADPLPEGKRTLGEPFNEAFDHAEDKAEPVVTVAPKTVILPQAERRTDAVMKAPVRPEDRRPFDDYPTEPGWTQVLLDRVDLYGTIMEPACGAGWMVQVLQQNGHDVVFSDLERDGADFLAYDGPQVPNVVSNPPYKILDDFAAKALEVATEKVALLLADFSLTGVNRTVNLWQKFPPAKLILVTSKMKVLGKVSMFPHVWVVWDHGHKGPTEFEWAVVPKEQRVDTSKLEPTVSRTNTKTTK